VVLNKQKMVRAHIFVVKLKRLLYFAKRTGIYFEKPKVQLSLTGLNTYNYDVVLKIKTPLGFLHNSE